MTAPTRGRGRPATFDAPAQQRYLKARRAGATQEQAAALVGVTARAVRKALTHNPALLAADRTATTARRTALAQQHLDNLPHGADRYKHHDCRCTTCTKAASAARAQSPDRTRKQAPVTALTQPAAEGPKVFPLARAS